MGEPKSRQTAMPPPFVVVVIGAGAIGGFVGCLLHGDPGCSVKFLVRRQAQIDAYQQTGFHATCSLDPDFRHGIAAQEVADVFTTDATVLSSCACVLVATKR